MAAEERTIEQEIYLALELLDIDTAYAVSKCLNKKGYANLTVCPECGVDDFVHVGDCNLRKVNSPDNNE